MNTSLQSFTSFCTSTCLSLAAFALIASSASAQQVSPRVPLAKPQAVPPPAVPPQRRAPEVTLKAKHGSWLVRCQKQKVRANPKSKPVSKKSSKGSRGNKTAAKPAVKVVEICVMQQQLKLAGSTRPVAVTVSVIKGQRQGKKFNLMRVTVPEGVYLPSGVALQVGSTPVGRFVYEVCLNRRCIASFDLTPKRHTALIKGKSAKIFIAINPQKNATFLLDLNGFGKALAAF